MVDCLEVGLEHAALVSPAPDPSNVGSTCCGSLSHTTDTPPPPSPYAHHLNPIYPLFFAQVALKVSYISHTMLLRELTNSADDSIVYVRPDIIRFKLLDYHLE